VETVTGVEFKKGVPSFSKVLESHVTVVGLTGEVFSRAGWVDCWVVSRNFGLDDLGFVLVEDWDGEDPARGVCWGSGFQSRT
jgi:hypothetical protein